MHRKPHQKLALGGTFDHFHIGHQHFIDFAANLSQQIVIGLTTDRLLKGKTFPDQIQDFHTRKKNLINYCKKKNYHCLIVPLDNPYGPPINKNEHFDALAVTEFTINGAKAINDLRKTIGLRPLQVHVCQMLKDQNDLVISSTRIRSGEINKDGVAYLSILSQNLTLSSQMRDFFSKPQGTIVFTVKKENFTAIVGDTTLKQALNDNSQFDLAVIDGKEQRKQINLAINKSEIKYSAINSAGQISTQMLQKLKEVVSTKQKYLFIDGEEDLATVALVLQLPLGSTIYYGQPGKGMVKVKVSSELKDKFFKVLSSN